MHTHNDTIAAPATAVGGAIAVIRVSGSQTIQVCDKIFAGKRRVSEVGGNTILYGNIVDGEQILDDVLLSVFRAPHSYTGEDSVEISCHGSRYIVAEILALLSRHSVRMAQAGEFTTRAYLAGKMDLSQAEAVADVIAASSRAAHAIASTQMRGGYSSALADLRGELLQLSSLLELELDFGEEDVEFADRGQLLSSMERIGAEIDKMRDSFSLGNAIKQGVAVAIVGAPNAGKSTLLNRLLGEDRAMVSDIAGTTRDSIEATITIDGVLFRFIDTAGIRSTDDKLEQMGIDRTFNQITQAQVVLQIIDSSATSAPEKLELREDQKHILIYNKIDAHTPVVDSDSLLISAKEGQGITQLCERLRQSIDTSTIYHGDAVVSNSRHYEALNQAHTALQDAMQALRNSTPSDLLAEDLRQITHHIGTITGEITTDEILGNIFSKFCIGK